jgi:steroid delta-isomerase-like uncharacterized protein
MPRDANKAIVRQLVDGFLNAHDLAVADEIFAEDLIDHQAGGSAGRESVKRFVSGLWESFPDLHCEIDHLVSEGDMVCVWVTGRGTHRGAFRGIAPTARSVTINGTSIMRIADGVIAERWNITDMEGLMAQLTQEQ